MMSAVESAKFAGVIPQLKPVNWEIIVIPNSLLMKAKFSVLGRRANKPLQLRRWIYFEVGYEHLAGKVIKDMRRMRFDGTYRQCRRKPASQLFIDGICADILTVCAALLAHRHRSRRCDRFSGAPAGFMRLCNAMASKYRIRAIKLVFHQQR